MSQATDFTSAFLAKLAGGAVNPTLQGIFAKILANQVTVDAAGKADFTGSFATLAKVFTFAVATDRPASGPLGYTTAQVDAAKTAAAAENGLTVGEEIPTEAPSEEPTEAPSEEPTDPDESFTLTTGVDTIPAEGQDNSGDDTIEAVLSAAIAEGTLQGTDTIDGGAGNDTLTVDMQQSFAGFTTGSMKNVETVNLTNKSVGAIDFEAKGVTGVTSYVVDATKGAVNLKSLAELAAVDVKGPAGDSTLAVEYTATSPVATGTQTDTQVLKVTDVGTINTAAAGAASNAKFMDVTIAKVEALDLTTAGTANSLNLAGLADTKTYKVGGAGQTEIEAVGAAITSFDASGATGNVIANLEAAGDAKLSSIKGGAGNDVVTVALGDLTTTAAIEGGAGDDRLDITGSAGKTLQATMSGVEAVRFTAPGAITGPVIFSGTNVTDLAKAEFKAGALAGNVSFVNQKAVPFEVLLEGAVTGSVVSADAAAAITANISNTATATGQAAADTALAFDNATGLTVNVNKLMEYKGNITTGTKGAVTVNVASNVVNNAETTEFTGTLTAAAATSVTINADGGLDHNTTAGDGADITAGKATTVTIKAGATSAAAVNLVAGEATTLNLTVGSKGLDMDGGGVTATKLDKVQNLTATNSGHVDFTSVALSAVSSATVTGSGESKATFAALGDAAQTYNLNLTATGQKAGLVTGDVNAGTGAATVNISGVTGNASMAAIKGAAGVTLNANKLAGTFNNGTNDIQATAGNVSIDVGSMEKAASLAAGANAIVAGDMAGANSNTKGDVTLTATNAIGAVTTGAITGNNVSIDATNALGGVTIGDGASTPATADIFAKTSVTYKGATLSTANNKADIQAVDSSTALTVDLSGAAGNEVFTVKGSKNQESITVKGNVGAGANSVAVTLVDQISKDKTQTVDLSGFTGSDKTTTITTTDLSAEVDGAITYKGSAMNDTIKIDGTTTAWNTAKTISVTDSTTTDSDTLELTAAAGGSNDIVMTGLSLSGIENLTVTADNSSTAGIVSINASAISAQSIKVQGSKIDQKLALSATEGNDVIDLSNLTTDSTNIIQLVITGGKGNDTIALAPSTSTNGKQIINEVVFSAAADNGTDSITGFTSGALASGGDILNLSAIAGVTVLADTSGVATTAAATDTTTAVDLAAKVHFISNQTLTTIDAVKAKVTDDGLAVGAWKLADNAKSIVFYGNVADGAQTFDVYYVEGATGATDTWTKIGVVGVNDGDALVTANFDLATV